MFAQRGLKMIKTFKKHEKFYFSKEGSASILLCFFFCKQQLLYFINMLGLLVIRKNTPYDTLLVYVVYYISLALFIYYCIRRCRVRTIWLLIAAGILVGGTVIVCRENVQYINQYGSRIFTEFLFPIIVLQQIENKEHIINSIRVGTFISGICMLIGYPINEIVLGNHTAADGYMVLTYMILIGFAGFSYYGITENKKCYVAIAIVLFLEMIMAGSRGPLICGFVITITALVRTYKNISKKNIASIVLIIIVLTIIATNINGILLFLGKIASANNINARVLDLIQKGHFINNESTEIRSDVFIYLNGKILENPLGYGFLGDRGVLSNINASYPHNLFYELVLQFGWIIGGLLGVEITYNIIRNIISSDFYGSYTASIDILVAIAFVKLMMTGSYVWESYFAMLVYLLINGKNVGGVYKKNENFMGG